MPIARDGPRQRRWQRALEFLPPDLLNTTLGGPPPTPPPGMQLLPARCPGPRRARVLGNGVWLFQSFLVTNVPGTVTLADAALGSVTLADAALGSVTLVDAARGSATLAVTAG